jgi:hypothetical protein
MPTDPKVFQDRVLLTVFDGDSTLTGICDKSGLGPVEAHKAMNRLRRLRHLEPYAIPTITTKGKRRLFRRYGKDCELAP